MTAPVKVPRNNLDLLRALAVMAVFACHFALALNGGQTQSGWINFPAIGRAGVVIFFVHTALVLMLSMERINRSGTVLLLSFYLRRVFRIYPLCVLMCILVSVFRIAPDVLGTPFDWSWKIFVGNVLLMQNVLHVRDLSGPMWSLALEIQMYFLLPVLFMVLGSARWRARMVLLFLASAAGLGLSVWLGRLVLLFFSPCFLAGILAWKLLPQTGARLPWWSLPLTTAALILGYACAPAYPVSHVILCGIVAGLIVITRDLEDGALARTARLIARYSYGLYLFHYPLMWVFYRQHLDLPAWERHLSFFALLIFITALCHHLIEAPMIKLGVQLSGRINPGGVRSQMSGTVPAENI